MAAQKAEKIKMALQKISEASVRKVFVKVITSDFAVLTLNNYQTIPKLSKPH